MKSLSAICFGLIVLSNAKCYSTTQQKFADSINHFTLNLYKELIKTENDNVICSGFSLASVLNMLLVGARGNTSSEINNTLGYERFGLTEQQIKDSYRQLLTHIKGSSHPGYELEVANSVWIQSGFGVLPEFVSNIENFFVEEKQIDFGNSSANQEINTWVSGKTKGRIPKLFDEPLDHLTRLVLANVVYFNSSWAMKFNKLDTTNKNFTSKDTTRAVPMMYINRGFLYANNSNLKAQILEIPYVDEDLSMVIFLPNSNDGLETLENELTVESIIEAFNFTEQYMQVTIPKFNFSSELPLNTVLPSLGIVKAYSPSEADLSGINGQQNLYVSDSIQKADIDVNEEGTVAGATSGAIINLLSGPRGIHFVADHPFLFIIVQKSTGIILFIGRVSKL